MRLNIVKYRTFSLIFVLLIFLDQITKYAIVSNMSLGQTMPLIGGFFGITYIVNTGAAFSMFKGANLFFVFLSAAFITVMLAYLYSRKNAPFLMQTAFAFIVGGAAGNLLDRIFRGHVVDFFDLKFFSVFNTADVMINLGIAMSILCIFLYSKELGH